MAGHFPHSLSRITPMLTRRPLFFAAALLSLGVFCQPALAQQGPEVTARAFVQETARQLLSVINTNSSLPEKQKLIRPMIDARVDVDGIARFCLGRFWRTASPDQQGDFLKLFHAVLVKSVSGKIGDYNGVTIDVGKAQMRDEGVIVTTTITRPNNAPAQVDWLVVTQAGQPRLADMIAAGTSLRLTTRKDYESYLNRNSNDVSALLAALHKQADTDGGA